MATLSIHKTPIEGLTVEIQPLIGSLEGGVFHMLPGGVLNEEGFKHSLEDIYAFTALGKGTFRGGHYHHVLNELFFTAGDV
jgi:dTDP-4-dehydrorhamnose 3,5-epimerase-like enzyme